VILLRVVGAWDRRDHSDEKQLALTITQTRRTRTLKGVGGTVWFAGAKGLETSRAGVSTNNTGESSMEEKGREEVT